MLTCGRSPASVVAGCTWTRSRIAKHDQLDVQVYSRKSQTKGTQSRVSGKVELHQCQSACDPEPYSSFATVKFLGASSGCSRMPALTFARPTLLRLSVPEGDGTLVPNSVPRTGDALLAPRTFNASRAPCTSGGRSVCPTLPPRTLAPDRFFRLRRSSPCPSSGSVRVPWRHC